MDNKTKACFRFNDCYIKTVYEYSIRLKHHKWSKESMQYEQLLT